MYKDNYFYYEINKSKFYTHIFKINNLDDFNQQLKIIVNQYKKIDHVCYLYKYNDVYNNQTIIKFNESSEPNGVFYKPIINLLNLKNINNIGIIVLRKFGGTKLGTGLLTRSYFYGVNQLINKWDN